MNKDRILIIFPGKDGTRLYEAWNKEIKDLSAMLPCTVLTCGKTKNIYQRKDNYIILNHSPVLYPLFAIFVCAMAQKYDTILLEYGPNTFYFDIFMMLIDKRKLIYRIKTYSWMDPNKKMSDRIFRNIKNFKGVIVTTKKGYEEINRYISSNKILKLVPGIDIVRYPYCEPKKFCAAHNPFKILFASGPLKGSKYPDIFEKKGINILLESIKSINDEMYNVRLYILWRGVYLKELEEKVTRMGLKNYVEIINQDVDIFNYYKECNATIFPATSLEHSPDFPSTIMESLCVGRPVIVSNILEVSDTIKETESGIVCNPNAKDLTNAIEKLVKNYKYYIENCKNMGESYFSIKRYATELTSYIEDKIKNHEKTK